MIWMQSRGLWSAHCPFCGGYQSAELDGLRLTERCYGAEARMEGQQEVGSGGGERERPKGDEGEAKEGLSWLGKDGLQAGMDGAAQKDRDGVTARERTGKGWWAGRDWGIWVEGPREGGAGWGGAARACGACGGGQAAQVCRSTARGVGGAGGGRLEGSSRTEPEEEGRRQARGHRRQGWAGRKRRLLLGSWGLLLGVPLWDPPSPGSSQGRNLSFLPPVWPPPRQGR